MFEQPSTLADFKIAVEAFARTALVELEERIAAGEGNFGIEKHFNRGSVRHDALGNRVVLSYFQELFYDIVLPELQLFPNADAYADFLTIRDPEAYQSDGIDAEDIMVYRLSYGTDEEARMVYEFCDA